VHTSDLTRKQQPSLVTEKRKPNLEEKRKPDHETELMSDSQPVLMTLRDKTKIERKKGQKEEPQQKMKRRENREKRRKCHTPFINTGCFAAHFPLPNVVYIPFCMQKHCQIKQLIGILPDS
jgi:hypothetical protein